MAPHESAIVVFGVHCEVQAPLFELAQARNASGLSLYPLQSRHQYRHQQRYDGDHHQKFDKSKSSSFVHVMFRPRCHAAVPELNSVVLLG